MKGTKRIRNLDVNNKCLLPHHYRLTYNIPYIRFLEPTDNILIAGRQRARLLFELDAMGLTAGVKKESLLLTCLDCRTEKRCDPELKIDAAITIIEFDAKADLLSNITTYLIKDWPRRGPSWN